MKRGSKLQDHLQQLDELLDQLASIGETVSELNKVAVLLRSVQESYPTLVTVLLTKGADKLTLKQALLDEEQRRAKAVKARTRTRKPAAGVCFRCRQAGHYQRDCCKPLSKSKHWPHLQNHHLSPLASIMLK